MTDYMQTLFNICFTMVTGVVVVGCLGTMASLAVMFWNIIIDKIN